MYLSFVSMLRSPKQRKTFSSIIKHVAAITGKSEAAVLGDVVYSGFKYGSTAQEYENLKFYERTKQNRATFITSYYNLQNYCRLNNREDREVFRDKVRFNSTFCDFISREWILIDQNAPKAIADFIGRHGSIIIKPRFGDSGKDIAFFDSDAATAVTAQDLAKKYSGFLAEEILLNHDDIKALNPSSLNTIRIITIVTKEDVEFLYAGIRIGAPGSRVDNISMGGKVAAINLNTGEIESGFQCKTTSEVQFKVDDFTGKMMPCWEELLRFVKNAARTVPGVRYVAWDVAITPKGPALIEGNHSSGNTITQANIDIDSPGLRPRLEEILKKC